MIDFALLFEHLSAGIVITSLESKVLYSNQSFSKITAITKKEIESKLYYYHLSINHQAEYLNEVNDLQSGNKSEFNITAQYANNCQVSHRTLLIDDKKNNLRYLLNEIEKIEIFNDKLYFNALINSLPDLIYFKDLQSRFLKVNKAYLDRSKTGSYDKLLGKTDFDLFTNQHAQEAYDDEQQIIKTQQPILNKEEEEIWSDGRKSWASTTKLPFKNENGDIIGTFGISRDITQFKQTELENNEKRNILNAITDKVPVVIYKYKESKGFSYIFGRNSLIDEFHKSKVIRHNIEQGLSLLVRKLVKTKNKQLAFKSVSNELYFENYLIKSDYESGEYIGLSLDVTDRKLATQRLRQNAIELAKTNEELNQFAYIVSHDLKAPLRGIATISSWIEEDLSESVDADMQENLQHLRSRVDRLENLITGILEYSRATRKKIPNDEVNVKELLEEIVQGININDTFKINISPNLPTVIFPKIYLSQIFSNLISNAIKYHDKSIGVIDIGHKKDKDYHTFFVQDDGPGIDKKFHDNIFKIFQTLQSRDSIESTGIGLSIVRKILEKCGGSIYLESKVGQGSKFIFSIPKHLVIDK